MSYTRNDGKTCEKDEARTPPFLFQKLDKEFNFGIDAFCTIENCICPMGFAREYQDSYELLWYETLNGEYDILPSVYGNPAYSPGNILKAVEKAIIESEKGLTIVLLIQSDTSTEYFKRCHDRAEQIRFLKPRVKFNNPDGTPMKGSPQTASMVVVFRKHAGLCRTSVWEWKK